MLPLDDPKWKSLQGGYRLPYDPTRALRRLYAGEDPETAWAELWEELHHQGDVGEASYASVPHLVKILEAGHSDWNGYALIATIEIERLRRCNPPIPGWLAPSYQSAWQDVVGVALRDYPKVNDPVTVRMILGVLALARGLMSIGTMLSEFDESEIKEILDGLTGG